jgi:hypothetical protein
LGAAQTCIAPTRKACSRLPPRPDFPHLSDVISDSRMQLRNIYSVADPAQPLGAKPEIVTDRIEKSLFADVAFGFE